MGLEMRLRLRRTSRPHCCYRRHGPCCEAMGLNRFHFDDFMVRSSIPAVGVHETDLSFALADYSPLYITTHLLSARYDLGL